MLNKLINLNQGESIANAVIDKVKNKGYLLATDIAPIESSPATASYDVGNYLIYNNELYKVTASIAIGDILTTGVNISKTSITSEMVQGGGQADSIKIDDVTNNKVYSAELQLYQGKPRIVYEEVE